MTVWLAIPSARPPAEANPTLLAWSAANYRIALWCDGMADAEAKVADLTLVGPYQGYASAVNALCKAILEEDPDAQWIIASGDDTLPDPNHSAVEIGQQCTDHFHIDWQVQLWCSEEDRRLKARETFGVMQPTGDRWAGGSIDRIAGSPWIGREFAQRMYGGNGPYFEGYRHMFLDEELQQVAEKLGVFWQRPDLIHRHNHFTRVGESVDWNHGHANMPDFLREANSQAHWDKYKTLFESRRASGFPGHEPLPLEVHA